MQPGRWLATPVVVVAVAASALDFATREVIPIGSPSRNLVSLKLNADDFADYVLATDAGITVLLGAGKAKFSSPTSMRLTPAPALLAAGDFDGDGTGDIASATMTTPGVRIAYGGNDGSFSDSVTLPTPGRVLFLHAADIDSDRRTELFVGSSDGILLFSSQGRGRFGEPKSVDTLNVEGRWFTTADLNGDDRIELILLETGGEAVGIFEVDEKGGFRPRQASFVGPDPRAAAVTDVDGDSHLDLVVAHARGVSWVRGDGKLRFTDPVELLRSDDISTVATFDTNADGAADIVAADRRRGVVYVLLNNGGGKFDRRLSYVVAPGPEVVLASDANGDGVADLLVTSRTSPAVTLCRGRGDGTFHGLPAFDLGPDPSVAIAYDANGDGHLDLAIVHREAGVVTLSLGDGHGGFRLSNTMPVGSDPRAIAFGHFDSDDHPDLVIANFGSDDAAVVSGGPRGTLAAPLFLATGLGPSAVAVADFDRDGHDDIAVANALSNSVSVIFSDGRGRFPRTLNYPVVPKPDFLLAGKLGGTGTIDLVVGNSRSETVSILRGSANGLQYPATDTFGHRVQPAVSADFDGDGIADVVRIEESEDKIALLRGQHNGGLALPERFSVGRQPSAAVAGDFDEDGKVDLVVLHRRTRTVAFLRNLTERSATGTSISPPAAETTDPWQRAVTTW